MEPKRSGDNSVPSGGLAVNQTPTPPTRIKTGLRWIYHCLVLGGGFGAAAFWFFTRGGHYPVDPTKLLFPYIHLLPTMAPRNQVLFLLLAQFPVYVALFKLLHSKFGLTAAMGILMVAHATAVCFAFKGGA